MNATATIKYTLLAAIMFATQAVWGQQATITYDSPVGSPYSAPIPSCVTISAEAWGAGGAGGRSNSSGQARGGGGGGAYAKSAITLAPGQSLYITVGRGGIATISETRNGEATFIENGGTSFVLAAGGGTPPAGNSTGGATGGLSSNSIGDVRYNGGNGGNGTGSGATDASGGGGGGAGSTGAGNGGGNGVASIWGSTAGAGGKGASLNGGGGGNGVSSGGTGSPGNNYGGGGGGSKEPLVSFGGDPQDGGNGAGGLAIITLDFTLPVISGTDTYCEGETLYLSVPSCSGASYQWKRNNADLVGETNSTLTISNVTTSHAGSYTVDVIMGGYTYSGGAVSVSGAGITYSSGTFTLTSNGFTVTVNPIPVIANKTVTICSGNTFTVTPTNTLPDVVPAGTTYSWATPSFPSGVTPTGTSYGTDQPNISGTLINTNTTPQTVTYVVTPKTTNNCSGTPFNVVVTVDPLPVASITAMPPTICVNGNYTIPSGGANAINGTILWTHNGNGSISDETTLAPIYTPTVADAGSTVTLTMTVTSNNACGSATDTKTLNITVDPLPVATITATPPSICANSSYTVPNGGATATYGTAYWTHDGNGVLTDEATLMPTYTPDATDAGSIITLTLTVTSNNACSAATDTKTLAITINTIPQIDPISLLTTTYCANEALDFPLLPPTVTSTLPITLEGWLLDGDPILDPYTLIAADNGKKLKYVATNDCGISYSNEITITVVVTEIMSITPASGPTAGGGTVTITGNGFVPFSTSPAPLVWFGTTAAMVNSYDNTTITCTPPPHLLSGYVTVSVNADCGSTTFSNGYYYESINISAVTDDFSPVTGGKTITISGTGLLATAGLEHLVTVTLCGVPATVLSVTDNTIVCTTSPSNYSQLGSIEIFNGVESNVFADRFTYYPVTFIANGAWSEPYNWETQTDDRILPYPDAVIHIKANCLQDIYVAMDSITVYPAKSYTLGSGITLDAHVFTLKDNASFLSNNGIINAWQQNVEHTLAKGRNWYVSNPIAGAQTIDDELGKGADGGDLTIGSVDLSSVVTPSDWRVEWYKEDEHAWQRLPFGSSLVTGQGYTVYSANEDIAVKFSGKYQNGNMTSPTLTRQNDLHEKRGFNLVGNPFPSYWRWTEATATSANVYSTIWYRTVINGGYEFWSYNAAGNVAVAPGWNDGTPTGAYSLAYIPPMQAFWVRIQEGQTSGVLTFSNSLRAHADHASNILKSQEIRDSEARQMVRLTVSGNKNDDETLLYTDNEALFGFDNYDSDKMFAGSGVEIFTFPVGQLRELVINGLPVIWDGLEIPLGFQTTEGGAFNIYANEILNIEPLHVYLRDSWRKTEHNLSADGAYGFTAVSEYNTERFSVVFRDAPTGNEAISREGDGFLRAYCDREGNIVALYGGTAEATVSVYDILGARLTEQPIFPNTSTVIKGKFNKGVYILRAGKYSAKIVVSN